MQQLIYCTHKGLQSPFFVHLSWKRAFDRVDNLECSHPQNVLLLSLDSKNKNISTEILFLANLKANFSSNPHQPVHLNIPKRVDHAIVRL